MLAKILSGEIFFLLLFGQIHSQQWIKIYSDSVNIQTNSIHEEYDKGYIFTGVKYEGWSYYGWIMKTTINGDKIWSKSYGDATDMNQFTLSRTMSDGGLILPGGTNKLTPGCTDPILIKVNACGEKEWCTMYNAQGCNSWISDIETTSANEYIALIEKWKSNEEERIWLFRLDSIGEVIWAQAYATDTTFASEWSHSLLKTTDSCFVITGEAYYPDPTYPNKWIIKIILIKVNLDGEAVFEVPWGTGNGIYSEGFQSIEDNKHSLYTSGEHPRTSGVGGDSPCIFKTSSLGAPVAYHDLLATTIKGISTTINWVQDSSLVLGTKWGYSSGVDTIGVFKTDTMGNVLKTKSLLTSLSGTLQSSAITFNDKAIFTGSFYNTGLWKVYAFKLTSDLEYDSVYTTPFTYDSLCPYPIVSDTIPLDDCEVVVVGIDEAQQDPQTTKLHIYPNPAGEQVTVAMPKYMVRKTAGNGVTATTIYHQWKDVRLEVFDLYGRLMFCQTVPQQQKSVTLEVAAWNAGMYLARVVFMNEVAAREKFVVE